MALQELSSLLLFLPVLMVALPSVAILLATMVNSLETLPSNTALALMPLDALAWAL